MVNSKEDRIAVFVENFRSLRGEHEITLAPITLLVGENSSGKTALLAALSASIRNIIPLPDRLQAEPFLLPTPQAQISEGETQMRLGSTRQTSQGPIKGSATFARAKGISYPVAVEMIVQEVFRVYGSRKGRQHRIDYRAEYMDDFGVVREPVPTYPPQSSPFPTNVSDLMLYMLRRRAPFAAGRSNQFPIVTAAVRTELRRLLQPRRVYASAPLRSKPQRIYEGREIVSSSFGEHIPQLLNTLSKSRSAGAMSIRKELDAFGRDSGLFDEIKSKRLRTPAGEMFSILLASAGHRQTIQDVGYGVSQALPIVAEVLFNSACDYFLLQQPEVHLHPKSQQHLASFMVRHAEAANTCFVIETHSDYIVDRIRLEVRRGNIPSDHVLLYYLSKPDRWTTIDPIRLDAEGNFVGEPDAFRAFFLRDQMELMGLQ